MDKVKKFVGIGEYYSTKSKEEIIKTMALGSCVAVILLCPSAKAFGMVHIAQPDSNADLTRAQQQPGYFADTAIPALYHSMTQLSWRCRKENIIAKVVGGAMVSSTKEDVFCIGQRNIASVMEILNREGIEILAIDVGKTISRTVAVTFDGLVEVSSPEYGKWNI
jgi:chemotaxis protein CheD